MLQRRSTAALFALTIFGIARADLPPVPQPAANPPTEEKRILGKILFWDEQLSSDNTVACGTCHRPAAGGGDPRSAVHPGRDAGTIDDVHGSPGIVHLDAHGRRTPHTLFGERPQVTRRSSPSIFGALWADEIFWDGRARGELRDPITGEIVIASGGALEAQTLQTLLNDAEMAKQDRSWSELTGKLESAAPLALAADLPPDVAAALATRTDYPALFAAAFGDPSITPIRIAFAIAVYERTLVADRTPWDTYVAGDESALTRGEIYGWQAMQDFHCVNCHVPPLFASDLFLNVGVRRSEFDRGREAVTGDPGDAGAVRVPSLRNAALRTRFMHTGEFTTLGAAISFYRTGPALPDRDDIPGAGIYAFNMGPLTEADIRAFLSTALVDPRVRDEQYPFDRPTLRSERHVDDVHAPNMPAMLRADIEPAGVALAWPAADDGTGVADYVVERGEEVIGFVTVTRFFDRATLPSRTVYRVIARDAAANESAPVEIVIDPSARH
jgi:cytochrome c peroxidase